MIPLPSFCSFCRPQRALRVEQKREVRAQVGLRTSFFLAPCEIPGEIPFKTYGSDLGIPVKYIVKSFSEHFKTYGYP